MAEAALVWPQWSLPRGVHAFVTTRHGGSSQPPWHSFNLGLHVGDSADAVAANRQQLLAALQQQSGAATVQIQWLQQVHGVNVVSINQIQQPPPIADALYTQQRGIALAVLTADCLPVLFCSQDGREVAVAHAGWRGMCNGILEATAAQFRCAPAAIRCWLGPAIGPCHFEVGADVRDAFIMLSRQSNMAATKAAFTAAKPGKWMADLYALARIRLQIAGINDISGTVQCTQCRHDEYFSYRREHDTGRFATGIVISG